MMMPNQASHLPNRRQMEKRLEAPGRKWNGKRIARFPERGWDCTIGRAPLLPRPACLGRDAHTHR